MSTAMQTIAWLRMAGFSDGEIARRCGIEVTAVRRLALSKAPASAEVEAELLKLWRGEQRRQAGRRR